MNLETHDFIVQHLSQAQRALELAQREAPAREGYMNFDMALQTVHGAQEAFGKTWLATRDPETAITLMKKGIGALGLFKAGEARTSIEIAIDHMKAIIDRLSPPQDVM